MANQTKVCAKCAATKPVSEFYRSSANVDGRQGWCKTCARAYNSRRRFTPTECDGESTKQCRSCDEHLLLSEFSVSRTYRDGRHRWCKKCSAEQKAASRYGMTRSEVVQRWGTACLICGGDFEVIDHDHQSGVVRGPLCTPCNQGLGNFSDDPARLRSAAQYLERGT